MRLLWLIPFVASAACAGEADVAKVMSEAQTAFRSGQRDEAIALATKAIEADKKNPQAWWLRAQFHDAMRQFEKAAADADEILKLEPKAAKILQFRGCARFRLAQLKESIADFDAYIALVPDAEPHHWQRGISYYYAGEFEKGRKQFELHQTVNASDVENAVFHFICVARKDGIEKARASLIQIDHDSRVPMMEIFALYAGKGTAEQVLAATQKGNVNPEILKDRLFYAHLYLGLYFEAAGDAAKAKEHILKAAGEYAQDHYMGDVARVHAKLLK
ncbi:MAG TPA: tetratricopeptide repeat protein [Planctomycetota bacterium]|nr:tetratricopeptide repeat protein [Planctomycetota bacterium]